MEKIVLSLGIIMSICVLASCATRGSDEVSRGRDMSTTEGSTVKYHHPIDYKGESLNK